MALRERDQNPTTSDTVRLRLYVGNANLPQNFYSIEKIDIYYLDPNAKTEENPDGRTYIETIAAGRVVNDEEGTYYVDISLPSPQYVVGNYLDIWEVIVEENVPSTPLENTFVIYPKLWYATTKPVIYDFDFTFQPNVITKGSKKHIIIEIIPNVPKASELEKYYTNLAISSVLYISIAKRCDPCLPAEEDLRTIVEEELVELREKVFAYYWLDTEEMVKGIYDIWFKLETGGNTYISSKNQMQIL